MTELDVSIIIPTYNRKDSLRETLTSLVQQTWPTDCFEVIVVDDGSTDGTEKVAGEAFPFTLRYIRQTNQGDAAARNWGAQVSRADILVFLDDDVLVESDYLTGIVHGHATSPKRIVMGTMRPWIEDTSSPFQSIHTQTGLSSTTARPMFLQLCSNNMSLRRDAYFSLGMMQGLGFHGSDMWCDVDFAYRAYQQGFEFLRSPTAVCYHRDYTARSLSSCAKRMETAARRAVILFQKYPELLSCIPMFHDKIPIAWRQDPPRLIARKLARHVASSRPALWGMEQIVSILEQRYPSPVLLRPFYRWIIGGHIFRGYRQGLREYSPVER